MVSCTCSQTSMGDRTTPFCTNMCRIYTPKIVVYKNKVHVLYMRCIHCGIRRDYFQSPEHSERPNCYVNTYHDFSDFPLVHQWINSWVKVCMGKSCVKVDTPTRSVPLVSFVRTSVDGPPAPERFTALDCHIPISASDSNTAAKICA